MLRRVSSMWSDARSRARLLAYGVPAAITAIVTQIWFRPGQFVAGGDVTVFVREGPASEMGTLWGHTITGAGSPAHQFTHLPEVLMLNVTEAIGIGAPEAQRLFYTLAMVALVCSTVYFVRALVPGEIPGAAAGLLIVFNPYMVQAIPLLLPVWLISLMGVSGGLILRAAGRSTVPRFALGVVAALAVFLVRNPPVLLMLILWIPLMVVLASRLTEAGGTGRAARYVVRSLPWVLLLSLWWVVPFLFTLIAGNAQFELTAKTATESGGAAWTHRRASIPNVLTLQSQWAWRLPQYNPFSQGMERPLWGPLKYALPALAFMAPLVAVRRKRTAALALAGVCLLLIFLGKGLHPPLGDLNRLLYSIPGFFLFRHPGDQLAMPLLLLYSTLAALSLERAVDLVRRPVVSRRVAAGVAFGLATATVVYPYPMYTGDVIVDERPDLPPQYVRLPEAWNDLAAEVNASSIDGKVLILPTTEYYQMRTTWGFHGSNRVPAYLLRRPVIQLRGGGYFADVSQFRSTVRKAERALAMGDLAAVPPLLDSLGVSHVILRRDFDPEYVEKHPARVPFGDPAPLQQGLDGIPTVSHVGSFGVADLYQVDGEQSRLISTHSSAVRPEDVGPSDLPYAVAGSAAETLVVEEAEGPLVFVAPPGSQELSFTTDAGTVAIGRRLLGAQPIAVTLRDGPRPALGLTDAHTVRIGDSTLPPLVDETVPLDGPVVALGTDRHVGLIGDGGGIVALQAGQTVTAYGERENRLPERFGTVSDCRKTDDRTIEEVGIAARELQRAAPLAVALEADDHAACVTPSVQGFDPGAVYLVRLEARSVRGAAPRLCMWEKGPNRCGLSQTLESSNQWQSLETVFVPSEETTELRLFLYADARDQPRGTAIEYRGVEVRELSEQAEVSVPPSTNAPAEVGLDPGPQTVSIDTGVTAPNVEAFSELRNCNRFDERSAVEAGLQARDLPTEPPLNVHLESVVHSACVNVPIDPVIPGMSYLVELEHRTVEGHRARICVWQETTRGCVALPALAESEEWHPYRALFTPEPGTSGLQLFVYADGGSDPERTVTEYRGVTVRPASMALSIVETPASDPGSPPEVSWSRAGPATYDVSVRGSEDPFFLTLRETFSNGWVIDGLPEDRTAEHLVAGGYANTWLISPGDPLELRVRYGPDVWIAITRAAALVAVAIAVVLRLRRRRRRPDSEPPAVGFDLDRDTSRAAGV